MINSLYFFLCNSRSKQTCCSSVVSRSADDVLRLVARRRSSPLVVVRRHRRASSPSLPYVRVFIGHCPPADHYYLIHYNYHIITIGMLRPDEGLNVVGIWMWACFRFLQLCQQQATSTPLQLCFDFLPAANNMPKILVWVCSSLEKRPSIAHLW